MTTPDDEARDADRAWRRAIARLRGLARVRSLCHPHRLAALAALALACAVAVLLVDMLEGVAARDVMSALTATGAMAVVASGLASAGSYAALVGFEWLALREADAEAEVAPRLAAFTGFISWSFTFVLGFGVLTGGAVRLRRYSRAGLKAAQIVRVTLYGTAFFWIGIAGLAGISLIAAPGVLEPLVGLPPGWTLAIGLTVTATLGLAVARGGRAVALAGRRFTLPAPRVGLAVVLLGVADTGLAALGLWFVLPAGSDIAFLAFLPIFAMATVAGVVSHAPGGVGAFEAVILLCVPGDPSALLASLLVFRLVYYVGPFVLGALAFAAAEVAPQRHRLSALPAMMTATLRPMAPPVLSTAVFGAGLLLLVSGALPVEAWRMSELKGLVPLPFVEVSNVLASLAGAALLIVGSGLKRQMRASWIAALGLLSTGVVVSLAKGFDYEEAAVCLLLIALLVLARDCFDRGGSALQAVSLRRVAGIGTAIVLSIVVGLLAQPDVDWFDTHWWEFAFQSDAPRFLRASLAALVLFGLMLLWRAVHHPVPHAAETPCAVRVAEAVAASPDPAAGLAFLGDKRFLFGGDGGFIMYQVHRGTHLAMGDPIAPCRDSAAALVWRFRELAHRAGGEAAFYQVSSAALPLYIEAGFSFAKLGEEAVVDLERFSMTGSRATRFRQMKARGERAGLTFEIVPAADIAGHLPQLQPISDIWLQRQGGREKGFSLGFWNPDYLAHFDHALVRREGEPVAFATLWRGADGAAVTIDLMRFAPDLPNGTMDYLFVALINALKARGVRQLSLGMAPLSGLTEHRLAPAWNNLGATVFRHGGAFYNFSGVREYKAKFKPDWRPRYLAHTGNRSVARLMLDATFIVARGPRGLDPARPQIQPGNAATAPALHRWSTGSPSNVEPATLAAK